MHKLTAEFRAPKEAAMLMVLHTDSVYTPARAHLRWGFEGACRLCGADSGDWMHYIQGCTRIPKMTDRETMPDFLRYTGNSPACWMQAPHSWEMCEEEDWTKVAAK